MDILYLNLPTLNDDWSVVKTYFCVVDIGSVNGSGLKAKSYSFNIIRINVWIRELQQV